MQEVTKKALYATLIALLLICAIPAWTFAGAWSNIDAWYDWPLLGIVSLIQIGAVCQFAEWFLASDPFWIEAKRMQGKENGEW